jgi:hypothetical protein
MRERIEHQRRLDKGTLRSTRTRTRPYSTLSVHQVKVLEEILNWMQQVKRKTHIEEKEV